jgi:RNA polymerase sigma-70 factor, ECF subfamily
MSGAENEHALLDRFRQGDREAFALIYRSNSPAVYRFALHMTSDPAKAAEITQDVFVWLIRNPVHFDPARGSLGAFLAGVARRILMRRWRDERRWAPLEEAGMRLDLISAERANVQESRADRLRELIAALPARYREVVVLCDLDGRTYEQAASILECAVGTVRSRLHRARELLARKFEAEKEKAKQECGV